MLSVLAILLTWLYPNIPGVTFNVYEQTALVPEAVFIQTDRGFEMRYALIGSADLKLSGWRVVTNVSGRSCVIEPRNDGRMHVFAVTAFTPYNGDTDPATK